MLLFDEVTGFGLIGWVCKKNVLFFKNVLWFDEIFETYAIFYEYSSTKCNKTIANVFSTMICKNIVIRNGKIVLKHERYLDEFQC